MKFSCKNYIFGLISFFAIPFSVNAEVDSLGLPVLKGWRKIDVGDAVLYINPIKYQIEVRGGYGRYLMEEKLYRRYQNPQGGYVGGVFQEKIYTVLDCVDKTYRIYGKLLGRDIQKRWKNIEVGSGKEVLARSCEFITMFPKTSYPKVR